MTKLPHDHFSSGSLSRSWHARRNNFFLVTYCAHTHTHTHTHTHKHTRTHTHTHPHTPTQPTHNHQHRNTHRPCPTPSTGTQTDSVNLKLLTRRCSPEFDCTLEYWGVSDVALIL